MAMRHFRTASRAGGLCIPIQGLDPAPAYAKATDGQACKPNARPACQRTT